MPFHTCDRKPRSRKTCAPCRNHDDLAIVPLTAGEKKIGSVARCPCLSRAWRKPGQWCKTFAVAHHFPPARAYHGMANGDPNLRAFQNQQPSCQRFARQNASAEDSIAHNKIAPLDVFALFAFS